MAKKIVRKVKLAIEAGKATPAPPVGTVVGPLGINIQEFCTRYNDATRDKMGNIIPVEISVYEDRSFDFIIKTPQTASLIKKAAKLDKASGKGANELVATITKDQVREIAEIKLPDLNAYDVEEAISIIEGSARNMGVAIKGVNDQELKEQSQEAAQLEKEMAIREAELEEAEARSQETAVDVPTVAETEQEDEEESE